MHENKHSCLERRLPGFCQMLRLSDPLMFCKCRCCRAKHLKLEEKQQENTQETTRTRSFGQSVEEENKNKKTKGSFNMADVVTVAVEGQLASYLGKRPCECVFMWTLWLHWASAGRAGGWMQRWVAGCCCCDAHGRRRAPQRGGERENRCWQSGLFFSPWLARGRKWNAHIWVSYWILGDKLEKRVEARSADRILLEFSWLMRQHADGNLCLFG